MLRRCYYRKKVVGDTLFDVVFDQLSRRCKQLSGLNQFVLAWQVLLDYLILRSISALGILRNLSENAMFLYTVMCG